MRTEEAFLFVVLPGSELQDASEFEVPARGRKRNVGATT